MEAITLDSFEKNVFKPAEIDISEKLAGLNRCFSTSIKPENGFYGIVETLKETGILERVGKNELGHTFKEYFSQDKLIKRRENLGNHETATTLFDDVGNAYSRTVTKLGDNKARVLSSELTPNITIVKNNFSAVIDAYGRPILNKVTDLTLSNQKRVDVTKFRDIAYKERDQGGHVIALEFDAPSTKENIVAQLDKVNLSKMKRVENIVKKLKNEGHTVDYEVKSNYVNSKQLRPSSFEPKITIDDNIVVDIPDDLKKIYNELDPGFLKRTATDLREKFGMTHETSLKSGACAAGLTFITSSVDNISACVAGEISAEEMAADIIKETAIAGAVGYGSTFVDVAVSNAMKQSSNALISRVGGSCLPAAAVSFAVMSYGTINDYIQGKIDGAELAYNLGDNAAGIAGSIAGAALAGAAVGSVVPGAGTAVGFTAGVVGGTVGCIIASEAYKTTVEVAVQGINALEANAQGIFDATTEIYNDVAVTVENAYEATAATIEEGINIVSAEAQHIIDSTADIYNDTAETLGQVAAEVSQEALAFADSAKEYAENTLSLIQQEVPDQFENARSAFNSFMQENGIPVTL